MYEAEDKSESADGINIKLMKCGGLSNAQIIYNLVTTANLYCMVGCMLESPIGIAAITSFAVSKPNLFYADLDAIALIKNNPINGGAKIIGNTITLSDDIGLGIKDLGESVEKIK